MKPEQVLQDVQFLNKYARYDYSTGKRETWGHTVQRTMDYLRKQTGDEMTDEEYNDLFLAILNKDVSPSMRLMATAGKGADQNQVGIYNCSFLPLEGHYDLYDLTILLGHGVGVGFSVEQRYVSHWPSLPEFTKVTSHFVIPDSIEGWASSILFQLACAFEGKRAAFDYSNIRPAGTPLLTRGGTASGPESLVAAHEAIGKIIERTWGGRFSSVDIFDMACHVAGAIVSGGVRRSAMIAIFDRDDTGMLECKSGTWYMDNLQRQYANISQVVDGKLSLEEWQDYVRLMDFNKSGEPGIWSRYAIKQHLPKRRRYVETMGPNPCFLEGTIVQTVDGPKPIEQITEPTFVYSMDENGRLVVRPATKAWKTRENAETLRITVSSGSELCVTPEHKIFVVGRGWVQAKDLKLGDVISHFRRARRGVRYAGVRLSTQGESEEKMEHRLVWEGVFGPLSSGEDVHHVDNNGYNNKLENLMALEHSEHSSLTRFSVPNNHQIFDENGKFATGNDSYKKEVVAIPSELEVKLGSFGSKGGVYVVSVVTGPVGDVYDLNVEDTHCLIANNIVAHNCVEQILRPRQFCNLSQIIARSDDTLETLERKIRLAAAIGTIQSSMQDFNDIDDEFRFNAEDERLLGVSISGIMDCHLISGGDKKILEHLRNAAIDENIKWAHRLGIKPSTSVTCVKPDGNTSVLYNSAPGVHGRFAPYYIRRMRVQYGTPVASFALAVGIPTEPAFGETWDNCKTLVLSFPVKSPDGAIIQNSRTAVEQLDNWLQFKKYFVETNPSVTIGYRPEELDDIAAWLFKHQDHTIGLSFLPIDDNSYAQMPYEEITAEQYAELSKVFETIDMKDFWRFENDTQDTTETAANLACVAGACLI